MSCFFFNDTATTEIYTLSLHDALPICPDASLAFGRSGQVTLPVLNAGNVAARGEANVELFVSLDGTLEPGRSLDRKSTRLNSSHANISYAVFCLKKK